jgi:glutathione S-transferase
VATLVHYHPSPWSEKARWALDHHRIVCRRIEHVPFLGEPLLRLWMRRPFEPVTVPLLLAEEIRLDDSLAIARWADDNGSAPTLFPREHQHHIADLNALGDRILEAGRARLTPRVRSSPAARVESVPRPLRRLGPLASAMVTVATNFMMKKYRTEEASQAEHEDTIRAGLLEVRRHLSGRDHVFDGFTYADIALAVTLQGVKPVSDRYLRLGPAYREVWTEPDLAREFDDLIAWRDQLYERHR